MNHPCRAALLASLGMVCLVVPSMPAAEPVPHAIVSGFERLYSGEKTDAAQGGRLLLGELNCISCHQPGDGGPLRKQAPVLDDVATRVRLGYLRKFLRDPQAVKPGSTMPNLFAGDPEQEQKVEALVHFLASTGSIRNDLVVNRPAMRAGRATYDEFGCVACHGTRDANGRPAQVLPSSVPLGDLAAKYTPASLAAFLEDPLRARPSGRMPRLLDARDAGRVAGYLLQGTSQTEDEEENFTIESALAEKGKAIFVATGCANCHTMKVKRKLLASTRRAPPLEALQGTRGCLSTAPPRELPHYALTPRQRRALEAALRSPAQAALTAAETVARGLATFNCYACHSRDHVGGPEEALNASFTTVQPEMGDEGRIPPALDGVGAKLEPAYFRELLDRGGHDRPYMHTRMPGFGSDNVGALVAAFASLDRVPAAPAVTFDESPARVKAAGRHLVGGQAFGCIKCHTFARFKAEGVQGIDMTVLTRRLRHDWFHAYVLDPQRFRPGTRMPSAFYQGTSMLPAFLGGKADQQIEAIWLYLQDGRNAQLPVGLQRQSIPLVPAQGAIIYRNFITGAGPRAIGVGYPEKANLAFDANEMRLALLWHGPFMDAARHWSGRSEGFEGPLGDNVLDLHGGAPFAVLARPEQPWPTAPARAQGFRFEGYRLTADDRPSFLYSLNDLHIEDFPNPVLGSEVSLRRMLRLAGASVPVNLYFRIAAGNKIEPLADSWFRIDGAWKVRMDCGSKPQIRRSAGKVELVVPVAFTDGKAQLIEEIAW